MYWTMTPISSMWPSSMIVGEPPGLTSAMLLPATSAANVGERLGFLAPDARGDRFEARRAGRVEQALEESDR